MCGKRAPCFQVLKILSPQHHSCPSPSHSPKGFSTSSLLPSKPSPHTPAKVLLEMPISPPSRVWHPLWPLLVLKTRPTPFLDLAHLPSLQSRGTDRPSCAARTRPAVYRDPASILHQVPNGHRSQLWGCLASPRTRTPSLPTLCPLPSAPCSPLHSGTGPSRVFVCFFFCALHPPPTRTLIQLLDLDAWSGGNCLLNVCSKRETDQEGGSGWEGPHVHRSEAPFKVSLRALNRACGEEQWRVKMSFLSQDVGFLCVPDVVAFVALT